MLDAAMPAGLEDVGEADDVAVDVGVRIFQRVAHPGLGGQVDHALRPELGEGLFDRAAVLQIGADQAEARPCQQRREARLFQARIVVGIDVVIAEHLVAALEQARAECGTYEAGCTGDQ